MYGVSKTTLVKWFRLQNIETGRQQILTPAQVAEVFDKIGTPKSEA